MYKKINIMQGHSYLIILTTKYKVNKFLNQMNIATPKHRYMKLRQFTIIKPGTHKLNYCNNLLPL